MTDKQFEHRIIRTMSVEQLHLEISEKQVHLPFKNITGMNNLYNVIVLDQLFIRYRGC